MATPIKIAKFINDLKVAYDRGLPEEHIKSLHIKYMNFDSTIQSKVDLMVGGILFEFKKDIIRLHRRWPAVMAQALYYFHRIAVSGTIGLPVPTHIVLVDVNEAVVFEVNQKIFELANTAGINWTKSASSPDKSLVDAVAAAGLAPQLHDLDTEAGLTTYTETILALVALKTSGGKCVVTKANFDGVFADWQKHIGVHITGVPKIGAYFSDDLSETSFFNEKRGDLFFPTYGKNFHVPAKDYNGFWSKYGRPPTAEVQKLVLAQQHMFSDPTSRRNEGAFYTPVELVKFSIPYLDAAMGTGWQKEYYVWDPCFGTGNLEVPLDLPAGRLFMSTLDVSEVQQASQLGLFPGANIFQFDFLNGEYADLPKALRDVIEDPAKKILVLMNPPYGECGTAAGSGSNKAEISNTVVGTMMNEGGMGKASRELFNQFLYRAQAWIPRAVVGLWAKMKYVNSPSTAAFRDKSFKYTCNGGFVFPGTMFPGVKGNFPIGFVVWDPSESWNPAASVTLDVVEVTK
jgi:hypothetical protein